MGLTEACYLTLQSTVLHSNIMISHKITHASCHNEPKCVFSAFQWSVFLMDLCFLLDLYCTLEVDSYGYFVSKAKTRVFRDTSEPQWNEVSHKDTSFYSVQSLHFCRCAIANVLFTFFCICVVEQEFEIELEGSQYLRILCYETCYDKSKLNKDDNEIVDKIMGKGSVQVRGRHALQAITDIHKERRLCPLGDVSQHVTHFN